MFLKYYMIAGTHAAKNAMNDVFGVYVTETEASTFNLEVQIG